MSFTLRQKFGHKVEVKQKSKKARTDGERGGILAPVRFHDSTGRTSLVVSGRSQREGWWDAGLEIPSDCLKQPSATLVGLILNGKWLPVQSTNGVHAMGRDETEKLVNLETLFTFAVLFQSVKQSTTRGSKGTVGKELISCVYIFIYRIICALVPDSHYGNSKTPSFLLILLCYTSASPFIQIYTK